VGLKQQNALREQALEFFERYHEIEELVGDARPFPGRLKLRPVRTPEEAEAGAEQLRKVWDLGSDPLPNVVELVENHGIKVYEIPDANRGFDGLSAETEAGPVIALADWLNTNLLRKRMTVLHELSHLVLPLPETMTEREDEDIAKRFAGALLLPQETFIAEFGRGRTGISMAELIELKANFGASIMAIMMRARQLGLIKEAVFVQFFKHVGAWRKAGEEPGDETYKGNESHSRFRQLVHRAVAEDHVSLSKGAALLHEDMAGFRRQLQERFA
jgi:Zn-dependent peptidase ImmA (M78 family)